LWWTLLTLAAEVAEAAAHEQAAALAGAACGQAALVGAACEQLALTGAARWQGTVSGMAALSTASPIRSVRET